MNRTLWLVWKNRSTNLGVVGSYVRHYARSFLDTREILKTIDVEKVLRLREQYRSLEQPPKYAKYLDIHEFMRLAFLRAYYLGLHRAPPMDILDLGTGAGYFPMACNFFGHRALGSDREEDPLFNSLTSLLGLERKVWKIQAFERAPEFGRRFDLITGFTLTFKHMARIGTAEEPRPWRIEEWEFFLQDLATNCLTQKGQVFLSLNLLKGFGCDEMFSYFVEKGAELRHGKVYFPSMRAFGTARRSSAGR